MNAVCYCRYSSSNQTEQSIEGQLNACYNFAKANGMTVIGEYVDRALTGTNDKREYFQRMIADSAKRQFEVVIVYQLDRFSRNRYDSAIYKAKLKRNGVKVVSTRENITEDASGVLMEAVLEGMAEYYSAELSQKVKRGLTISANKCKHVGSSIPFGYRVNESKNYEVDYMMAPIVQTCYELYAAGQTIKQINEHLTVQYGKSYFGNPYNALNRILSNRNYIGYYTRCGSNIENGMPRIVSDELFERVQQILDKNKKAPARARAHEEYLLTTKLYCGYDREMMVGVSGTSKTGAIHNYYTCKGVLRKTGCKKKNVKKGYIEDLILSKTREQLTDDNIGIIAKAVSEISSKQSNAPVISELKRKLKENATAIDNLVTAIERGEHMDLISDRITKKKEEKAEFEKALAREQIDKTDLSESEIKFFLSKLKTGDINDMKYRRALIVIFVSAIYLYDDRVTIVFNASERPLTVDYTLLDEIESGIDKDVGVSSYMKCTSPPWK